MRTIELPKDRLLSKSEMQKISGGESYICTCWNEDGTQTILPGDASSPEECAWRCLRYRQGLPTE